MITFLKEKTGASFNKKPMSIGSVAINANNLQKMNEHLDTFNENHDRCFIIYGIKDKSFFTPMEEIFNTEPYRNSYGCIIHNRLFCRVAPRVKLVLTPDCEDLLAIIDFVNRRDYIESVHMMYKSDSRISSIPDVSNILNLIKKPVSLEFVYQCNNTSGSYSMSRWTLPVSSKLYTDTDNDFEFVTKMSKQFIGGHVQGSLVVLVKDKNSMPKQLNSLINKSQIETVYGAYHFTMRHNGMLIDVQILDEKTMEQEYNLYTEGATQKYLTSVG